MSPLPTWLDTWRAKAEDFWEPDKDKIYDRSVRASLAEPETERLLDKRDGADGDAVITQMRTPAYRHFVLTRCPSTSLDKACDELVEIHDRHEDAASTTQWNWQAACALIALAVLTVLVFGGLLVLAAAGLAAAAALFALFWRGSAVWFNLRWSLVAAGRGALLLAQRVTVGVRAAQWGQELRERGTGPVVAQLVRHLLGDDPDSLFIPDDYEIGLRALRVPGFVVENGAARQLQRKLTQMIDGTIAVCGPRGAGKTTLLEQCVERAGFGVLAQAPATYTPHDFLLSLSVRLCKAYMDQRGYAAPEFTRLSPTRRLLRRMWLQVKRLGRWSSFAVPAAALLVLGLSASARALYAQYAASTADLVRTYTGRARDYGVEMWQGHAVVASVSVIIAGIAWWQSRHTAWLPRLLGRLWVWGSRPLGLLLVVGSVASVAFDDQLRQQVRHLERTQEEALARLALYTLALTVVWMFCRAAVASRAMIPLGVWRISLRTVFQPVAAAVGTLLLLYLVRTPQSHGLLADPDNPLRLGGVLAGILIARMGGWSPRPQEPELVTRCRNHLYRLQTIQQSTNGLTTGAAQVLSLGSTHTTSVSTLPPNYPELVEEFRALLKDIAAEKAVQNKTVVIAIDEVDRLGSDTQALAFLREIKAILGVPFVHYLISVADDVGAAFVRRGLPHRDVTDSSLDDIVHVQPSTLAESRAIFAKRSDTLMGPYVMLAHALSGGVLRDLLRYGLQISEIQAETQSYELTDISRRLVLEELAETFAGFRTLLSKQQWTHDTRDVLASFRILSSYLRDPCPCAQAEIQHALNQFAFHTDSGQQPNAGPDHELPDGVRQLIDEASAYAYFSLTLLGIFSTEGFDRRTRLAAAHGPDGDPDRLAEARQELGISPHSARSLIENIRKAWSLPLGPTPSRRLRPYLDTCQRHGPRTNRRGGPAAFFGNSDGA